MNTQRQPIDVDAVRARHPLADVVAAAGVELQPRGHGLIGCCPFHEDTTPSLSVDGVPDRFHCFGCGASGDVIDFVQRTRNLDFLSAVAELDGGQYRGRHLRVVPQMPQLRAVTPPAADITTSRAFAINQLAWDHFATPVGVSFATHYLRHRRGIDLTAMSSDFPAQRFVGHATHGWATLTDHLRRLGVQDDELVALDLSMRTRGGRLIDTYRNRLILPVTSERGAIHGFIGRDISGHPAAPRYRNPTRTPVFDKSQILYRPSHHHLDPDAQVLVVEGALDALAVAASAAATHTTSRLAVCSTNGVSVSSAQARVVLSMTRRPPRIAFDGDEAGRQGASRWLITACLEQRLPVLLTRMPSGSDPADWLAANGPAGLPDLLADPSRAQDPEVPRTVVPGRELVQVLLDRAGHATSEAVEIVTGLAAYLAPAERTQLLRESDAEMTRHGRNPRGTYTAALTDALHRSAATHPAMQRETSTPSLT
ncbi:CHC2 zinc finger domain-containing protein [Terrabacter sp. RAF57]|uniref:CHC2 zinc finger domain-containing protein n=1 Tax=Terrabacter sp. RAF57 TaxID=3233063 RepID=UPI003F987B57